MIKTLELDGEIAENFATFEYIDGDKKTVFKLFHTAVNPRGTVASIFSVRVL